MLDLIRFDPWRGVTTRGAENWLLGPTLFRRLEGDEGVLTPKVDVVEGDAEYLIRAEVPGVAAKDVHLEIDKGRLTLRGEINEEKEESKGNYHWKERRSGSFVRSFNLPDDANGERVEAALKDGVLTVTIPKAEEAKPKSIEVKVN